MPQKKNQKHQTQACTSNSNAMTRRDFIRAGCVTALTFSALSSTMTASAVDKVSEDDPTAVALGYKHDATAVDLTKFPKRADQAGQKQWCDNCALYANASDPDAEWAPCSIFQNRLVAGKGWCNAWVQKA